MIVTIPLKAVPDLPDGVLDAAAEDVAVIDTGNYYPLQRDGRICGIEDDGLTESRWTAQKTGHTVTWTATARPAPPTAWPSRWPATARPRSSACAT